MPRSTPLFRRIKARLCEEFDGLDPRGLPVRLPSERELQTRYGVSRPTISKALAELSADGRVVRAPGSGSFLLPRTSAPVVRDRVIGYVAVISSHELTQRCLRGIDRAARRRGYRVLMSNAGSTMDDEEEAARDLIAAGVGGLVIYPISRLREEFPRDYLRRPDLGVPAVVIDTGLPEYPYPRVGFDNWRGGYELTRWLLQDRRRSRVAAVTFADLWVHATLPPRLQGYRDCLLDAGFPESAALVRRYHPDHPEELEGVVEELLALPHPPDAILAAEDRTAMALIRALEHHGVAVPEQVLVTGWDNREASRHFHPAFPTANPDFERLGELATDLLVREMTAPSPSPPNHVLEVALLLNRREGPRGARHPVRVHANLSAPGRRAEEAATPPAPAPH